MPFVYQAVVGERVRHLVSPLTPEEVGEHGLCTEAVLGLVALGVDTLLPDHFEENPAFVRFLHETIADAYHVVPALREAAELVDGHATLPLADGRGDGVFGHVEARDGRLVPMSYRPDESHRLYTSGGFFELPESLELTLLRRMRDLQATAPELAD
ncbi:hypothetical protein ABZS66_48690 [Dactylosporangium sp. NPDC005572]|uniref:hypothetical protein n=1 Tax=Dactylosporangium sp. NPDC005572 TaxID=3156889 RepID=UPI0033A747A5